MPFLFFSYQKTFKKNDLFALFGNKKKVFAHSTCKLPANNPRGKRKKLFALSGYNKECFEPPTCKLPANNLQKRQEVASLLCATLSG